MNTAINLHQELKRGSFDFAMVATYELDVQFFENFVLDRFDAFAGCANIVLFLDVSTHAKMLQAQGADRPRRAGLRYLPAPVHCRGVFHPKIYLFASADRGLLVIGSANLTRAGLSKNAELVSVMRYQRSKDENHLPLLQDAFEFLTTVASRPEVVNKFETTLLRV